MKTEYAQIGVIVGIGVLSAITGYLIVSKKKNTSEETKIMGIIANWGSIGSAGQGLITGDYNSLPDGTFPLNYGDSNKQVYLMQQALNRKNHTNLAISGKFDLATSQELCKNYFTSCISWLYPDGIQKTYSVSQTDYDNILSS